jgi:hypothetical protein
MSKQIFHHFSKWEDYKFGFYNTTCENTEEHIKKSVNLLSNQDEFYKYAKRMINEWFFSCEQNLTDPSLNKIAYIGQSSCCLANNTPAFVTRLAWSYIDEFDQLSANKTAKKILKEWQYRNMIKGTLWEK